MSVEHLDCVHRQPLQLTHGRSFTCLLRTPYVGDNLWRRSCIVFFVYIHLFYLTIGSNMSMLALIFVYWSSILCV